MSGLDGVGRKPPRISYEGAGISIYLSRLTPGQKWQIKCLPLYRLDEDNRPLRTDYFLQGVLSCQEPGRFFFELQARFGAHPPREASIKVQQSGLDPNCLIKKGKPLQVTGLPFEIDPEKESVVFVVSTDGSSGVPKSLFTLLRNVPADQTSDDEPTIPFGFLIKTTEER